VEGEDAREEGGGEEKRQYVVGPRAEESATGPNTKAALHQDTYGDVVFPLQIAVMLNQPGEDFTGGENVFVEQRPRFQSRAIVVKPQLGQGMIFPVRHRPIRGKNGYRRHPVRHGTDAVESGHRNTLGVIFHNAR
jgi:hypothetical protein